MTRITIAACLVAAALAGAALFDSIWAVGSDQDNLATRALNNNDSKVPDMMPLNEKPRSLKPISFTNTEGEDLDLSNWRGKVVLLNIWATWCAPCREEMPTLDNLQLQLGGPDFEVVALSIDRAGVGVIQNFFNDISIKHLEIYVDQTMKASTDLGAYGIPTTLLISTKGLEIGRLAGPAKWDSPEMIAFLRSQIVPHTQEK